jgi:hypothetical protein
MQWVASGMPPLVRDRINRRATPRQPASYIIQVLPMGFKSHGYRVEPVLRDLDAVLVIILNSIDPRELNHFTASVPQPFSAATTPSQFISPPRCSGSQSSSGDSVKSITPNGLTLHIASQPTVLSNARSSDMRHARLFDILELRGAERALDYSPGRTRPNNNGTSQPLDDTLWSMFAQKQVREFQGSRDPSQANGFEAEPRNLLRKRKRFSVKHYSDAAPSTHCHVCK